MGDREEQGKFDYDLERRMIALALKKANADSIHNMNNVETDSIEIVE
jgi:hypothetical protein